MSMPACSHVGHKSLGILKKKNENKDKLVMNAVEERIQETNKLHASSKLFLPLYFDEF